MGWRFSVWTVAVIFGSAGRPDLPFVLAYVGIDTVLVFAGVFTVHPSLQHGRWRPAPGGADLLPMLLLGPFGGGRAGCGPIHWRGYVPSRVQMARLAVSATSWVVVLCAMVVNRRFAAARTRQRR